MKIGAKRRPLPGERVCGDASVVARDGPRTTIGVCDGLGHGEKAASAADSFCLLVRETHTATLLEILRAADKALRGSRGVAATLLRFDSEKNSLAFVGVGNVRVRAQAQTPITPIPRPGFVGGNCGRPQQFIYDVVPGDLIAVFSDGVSSRFDLKAYCNMGEPQEIAEAVVADHGKQSDDAICVVIRY